MPKTKMKTIKNNIVTHYESETNKLRPALITDPELIKAKLKHDYEENERQYIEAKKNLETDIKNLRDDNEDLEQQIKEAEQDIKNLSLIHI